jgi:SAM-dependent methyltransferase
MKFTRISARNVMLKGKHYKQHLCLWIQKALMFMKRGKSKQMGRLEMNKVSELWSQKATPEDWENRKLVSWCVHPFVEKHYVHRMMSGSPHMDWLTYIKNKYVPNRLEYGLDLGCGSGSLEVRALKEGICQKMDAFDIAEEAIRIARKNAELEKIDRHVNYQVQDINRIELKQNKYDIVFTPSSAHHFKNLEHVFEEINKSLKPSCLFVLVEYIGPSQFQWTDKQLRIVNELLEILPIKYRRCITAIGTVRERAERPSIEFMNAYDPSEAIHSADIVPLVDRYFNIIEKVDFGGTLLHLLLHDIVGNFSESREEDITILKLLCYFERTLIEEKVIPSDFALIVVTPRK